MPRVRLYSCTVKRKQDKIKLLLLLLYYDKHFNLYQLKGEQMSCNMYMHILNTQTGSICAVTAQYYVCNYYNSHELFIDIPKRAFLICCLSKCQSETDTATDHR
jgi:hypothetical protein